MANEPDFLRTTALIHRNRLNAIEMPASMQASEGPGDEGISTTPMGALDAGEASVDLGDVTLAVDVAAALQ